MLQLTEQLSKWWWIWLVAGTLWIIASLIILQFSTASLVTVGVIFGVLFLVAGIQEFLLAAWHRVGSGSLSSWAASWWSGASMPWSILSAPSSRSRIAGLPVPARWGLLDD